MTRRLTKSSLPPVLAGIRFDRFANIRVRYRGGSSHIVGHHKFGLGEVAGEQHTAWQRLAERGALPPIEIGSEELCARPDRVDIALLYYEKLESWKRYWRDA